MKKPAPGPKKNIIRLVPSSREIELSGRRAEAAFEVQLQTQENIIFSVDVYSFQPQNHPENHLGWWHFNLEDGKHALRLAFDFSRLHERSVRLFDGPSEVTSPNFWFNTDYALDPLQECKLVFWNTRNEVVSLHRLLLKVKERPVLRDFLVRHHRKDGYAPELPFLDLLHHYKLKILDRYFRRHFRGRVLDVGCGLSLFTEIPRTFPFRIIAGDLVLERMRARKAERPDITWTVFDASRPSFKPEAFDALFAGEILEHLPFPEEALWEWSRLLKPGGMLILTTPNRKRRVNVLNREDWPFSPDHLREFSFEELNREMLPAAGFDPLKKKGLYLELLTRSNRWWKEDYLQREGNKKKNRFLMKSLFRLGYFFPKRSLTLLTVAKKTERMNPSILPRE